MKTIHAIAGAALLAAVTAGSLPAQDSAQAPQQRPRQMRLHAPGTGLEGGPAMHQQTGRMGARLGEMAGMGAYCPQMLIARKDLLGLSDEQVSQIEQLSADAQAAQEQAMEAVKQSQEQLQEAWAADQPDPAAVRRYAQAGMEARQTARLATLDGAARAKALLTPEQQGKLEGFVEGRRMGMRQRGMRGSHRALGMRQHYPGR